MCKELGGTIIITKGLWRLEDMNPKMSSRRLNISSSYYKHLYVLKTDLYSFL